MSDELCELLAQYPDSQRLAISVGGEGVPIGLNVGELTVLLAQSDALHASQARLSEAVNVLERIMAVVTYPCDTSIQARGYGVRSIDVSGCEYIAEAIDAFITTLRGEK